MTEISLTSGMRDTLLSARQTDTKMRRTLERLATGKKVNSPLDNPTSYFIAHSLRNAASDIDQLHHTISEGVNVIKSTENGLQGVLAFLQSMKALVDSAATSSDPAKKEGLAKSFDETYAHINALVRDSGYAGMSLISDSGTDPLTVVSDDLDIPLNPQDTASALVTGSFMGSEYVLHETPGGSPAWVADDHGVFMTGYGVSSGGSVGNLADVALVVRMNPQHDAIGDTSGDGVLQAGEGTEIDFRLTNNGATTAANVSFSNAQVSTGWHFVANQSASFGNVAPGSTVITNTGTDLDLNLPAGSDGASFFISLNVTSDGVTKPMTFGPFTVGAITNGQVVTATSAAPPAPPTVMTESLKLESADYDQGVLEVTFPGPPPVQKRLYAEKQGLQIYHSWVYDGFQSHSGIEAARSDLEKAISRVRGYSAEIGSALMVVTLRTQFNDLISETYLTGADNLTLADMNEESANSLMLHTRQELGATSMSMAGEASRAVLKMLE